VSVERLEVLKPLCRPDDSHPSSARLATPFELLWRDRRYACASDGHKLAAFVYDGELRADGPDVPAVLPKTEPTHVAPVGALLAWAGKETFESCEACEGSGEFYCNCPTCHVQHKCEECGGEGEVPELREGLMLGDLVNLDYVREILQTLPEGVEQVALVHEGKLAPFGFSADGWLACIMPIRDDPDPTTPEFIPEPIRQAVL
jgi:hypothetical protein